MGTGDTEGTWQGQVWVLGTPRGRGRAVCWVVGILRGCGRAGCGCWVRCLGHFWGSAGAELKLCQSPTFRDSPEEDLEVGKALEGPNEQ